MKTKSKTPPRPKLYTAKSIDDDCIPELVADLSRLLADSSGQSLRNIRVGGQSQSASGTDKVDGEIDAFHLEK